MGFSTPLIQDPGGDVVHRRVAQWCQASGHRQESLIAAPLEGDEGDLQDESSETSWSSSERQGGHGSIVGVDVATRHGMYLSWTGPLLLLLLLCLHFASMKIGGDHPTDSHPTVPRPGFSLRLTLGRPVCGPGDFFSRAPIRRPATGSLGGGG